MNKNFYSDFLDLPENVTTRLGNLLYETIITYDEVYKYILHKNSVMSELIFRNHIFSHQCQVCPTRYCSKTASLPPVRTLTWVLDEV